jgi:ankyrin repeat protein
MPAFRIAGQTASSVFKAPHLAELAEAACKGDVEAVGRAVQAGADPNGLSVDGGTPMLWAVYCDNPIGVQALLNVGADPNLKARQKYSATLVAAAAEDPAVLRVILDSRGDPNTDDRSNWSGLRLAFLQGTTKDRWENYYSLLDHGADVNRLGPDGTTIAFDAAAAGRFDKVEELLSRGYSRDLEWLGATVQNRRLAPTDPQNAYRAKVVAMLEQKGVRFPIPPLHRGER